ncbi:MAG: stage II sporulation protein R [Defluviitaleaceae bacterium]|nr:stage II sporulation protein R [Defluviitaleaceae bacterium]
MTDKMKLGLVFGAIVVVFMIQFITGSMTEVEAHALEVEETLRLRVISHSDEPFDQAVKRLAVFAIEGFMNAHEEGHTVAFLTQHLETVHQLVVDVLNELEIFKDVEVSFGYHYFPVSSRYYPSLVVRLGDATGSNWWCFINPGVCLVPSDAYASVNAAQVEVKAALQESIGTRTRHFIRGLFNRGESRTVAEGEIDWFLFPDE